MNLSSKELKRQARENLNGRYGLPMGTFVVTALAVQAAAFPFRYSYQKNPTTLQLNILTLAIIIISVLSIIPYCGIIRIHLDMARGKEKNFSDLFYYFNHRPDRMLLPILLLILLFFVILIPSYVCIVCYRFFHTGGWMILTLFLIAATTVLFCFLTLSFNLVYYFLVDNETIGTMTAFRLSWEHMKGNRGRLLYIWLSFMGMALLGLLSFGIGFLWVTPYISQTIAVFYRNIIGEVS
ncbi:MAG: DUF975 family protein [Lachnospiraceae bacterium]|nr:DUF975 family protein [Lachnospiraceae bacterium]MDE6981945.1 DUF975 family protein [Lachnospiraceae bacterium]